MIFIYPNLTMDENNGSFGLCGKCREIKSLVINKISDREMHAPSIRRFFLTKMRCKF